MLNCQGENLMSALSAPNVRPLNTHASTRMPSFRLLHFRPPNIKYPHRHLGQAARVDCCGYFVLDGTTDPQPDENLHLPLAPAQPGTSKMHPWCYLQTDRNPGTLTAVGLESWTKLGPIYLMLLWMLDMESLYNFCFRILQSSFCDMLRAHEVLGYHQFGGADNLDWSYCWRVHHGLWLNLNSSQGHKMVNHK